MHSAIIDNKLKIKNKKVDFKLSIKIPIFLFVFLSLFIYNVNGLTEKMLKSIFIYLEICLGA